MTEEEAVRIANEYILQRIGSEPTFAGEPCRYELRIAALYKASSWTVRYKTVMVHSPEDVVDDDIMIVVDSTTREARFFNEL